MFTKEKLDREWVQLIAKAKQMGFSAHDIRSFFQQAVTANRENAKEEK